MKIGKFYILTIFMLLIYPALSKAEENKVQKYECEIYKSLDQIKHLDTIKHLINTEQTYKIKYDMLPLRILFIPSITNMFDAQVAVSGKPESATKFTFSRNEVFQQDGGVEYYPFVNIPSGDLLMMAFKTGTAYYIRNNNFYAYKCEKE